MITLEISSTDIRLMEAERGRVMKWASLSLDPAMIEGGVISDPLALSTAIKQLMTSSGIKGKDVIASISGLYSINRILTVPTHSKGLITEEAVMAAVREVIPLTTDELYLSWQTITPGEDEQQVLVVGVPRDALDAEMQALRAAHINPRLLGFKGMALAMAVNREQALILNIEPSSFDIVVVANGIAEVMRTTAWQQDDLTVEDRAEHLAVNLELTVGFYNSHHPAFPLDPATPLFITGQMSGDFALMEKLQGGAGYPIEPLAPPLECPAHMPVSQYAVNIGLALKGTAPSKSLNQGGYLLPDINLLPEVYRPWKPSAKQLYFFCGIVAFIALLFPLYQLTSDAMNETATLKTRYGIINNELQRRQVEIRNREPLQRVISQYDAIVDMGGGFVDDLEVITSLAEELGVEVQLPITHAGSSITFSCQALDNDYLTFRSYITALRESGWFSSVTPPTEQEEYPPEYNTGGPLTLKR